jgi:hypothetical protein
MTKIIKGKKLTKRQKKHKENNRPKSTRRCIPSLFLSPSMSTSSSDRTDGDADEEDEEEEDEDEDEDAEDGDTSAKLSTRPALRNSASLRSTASSTSSSLVMARTAACR